MKLAIILIVMAAVLFGAEKILRRWLNIKKVKLSDTPARNIEWWGKGVILAAALFFVPFAVGIGDGSSILWFWVVYLSALLLFQAYLQWRYIKESKEYIVTLAALPLTITALLIANFIYF